MREAYYDLYLFIYTKTGEFDEVIFSLPFVVISVVIYRGARKRRLKRTLPDYDAARRDMRANELSRTLFFSWFVELVFVTLTPSGFWGSFWTGLMSFRLFDFGLWRFSAEKPNFVPVLIKYAVGQLEQFDVLMKHIISHLAVNVLLFVPLGVFLPLLGRAGLLKTVLTGAALSLSVEIIQIFISRGSDIDDVLCNILGTAVGYLLFCLVKKRFPNLVEKCRYSPADNKTPER